MKLLQCGLGALPPALLLLTSQVAAQTSKPTALRKMSPDENEKFFPDYVAFPPSADHPSYQAALSPRDAILALRGTEPEGHTVPRYRPPFQLHGEKASQWDVFRRAAEAVRLLSKREACPESMESCDDVGFPNKCCFDGESCVEVNDSKVGNVACCPEGATCNGGVAECPATAVTCPENLGGGCCIPGYVCKGLGCVLSSATPTQTATTTSTRTVNTQTTTQPTTTSPPTTSNPGAPFRPTSTDGESAGADSDVPSGDFCPVGYYACLARAGGGCCRTGRDCATTSCPPTPMTTIISGSLTIAVPVTDVPDSDDVRTCATGWYLCGEEAGPVAGCCPDEYSCGTASCTLITAEETAEIQKSFPGGGRSLKSDIGRVVAVGGLVMGLLLAPW